MLLSPQPNFGYAFKIAKRRWAWLANECPEDFSQTVALACCRCDEKSVKLAREIDRAMYALAKAFGFQRHTKKRWRKDEDAVTESSVVVEIDRELSLRECLTVVRDELKLNDTQLAQALGVSKGAVSQWQSKTARPKECIILALRAVALKLKPVAPWAIADVRNVLGLSQIKFANLLAIQPKNINEYEQGRQQPRAYVLLAIAALAQQEKIR